MLRLLTFLLFGYCAYRIGREFIDSVPDDFEMPGTPKGLLPPPRRRQPAKKRPGGADMRRPA